MHPNINTTTVGHGYAVTKDLGIHDRTLCVGCARRAAAANTHCGNASQPTWRHKTRSYGQSNLLKACIYTHTHNYELHKH